MVEVDVVVVSYNSSRTLRSCVEPLAVTDDSNVIVVDNASRDGSLESISDLPVTILGLDVNLGFAHGCNRGWTTGSAPAVLFLNPDARIEPESLRCLKRVLDDNPAAGLVAPRITAEDGSVEFSVRRFPRLRSTYARAFFLHRLFPRATWSDEMIRDPDTYERPGRVDWVSGACVLVRRAALERIGGWDEGFFLYGEDIDLCRRLSLAGYEVRYEPSAQATHEGGASAPRGAMLPMLAASRVRYARLHQNQGAAFLERVGVAAGELTHAALTTKGAQVRVGHLRALRLACTRRPDASRPASNPVSVSSRLDTL